MLIDLRNALRRFYDAQGFLLGSALSFSFLLCLAPLALLFFSGTGFLLASDYHGSWAQQQFDDEISRVLQPGRYPIIDLTPPLKGDHPIWHTMFNVTQLPQMASINTWRRTGDVQTRAASPTSTAA